MRNRLENKRQRRAAVKEIQSVIEEELNFEEDFSDFYDSDSDYDYDLWTMDPWDLWDPFEPEPEPSVYDDPYALSFDDFPLYY